MDKRMKDLIREQEFMNSRKGRPFDPVLIPKMEYRHLPMHLIPRSGFFKRLTPRYHPHPNCVRQFQDLQALFAEKLGCLPENSSYFGRRKIQTSVKSAKPIPAVGAEDVGCDGKTVVEDVPPAPVDEKMKEAEKARKAGKKAKKEKTKMAVRSDECPSKKQMLECSTTVQAGQSVVPQSEEFVERKLNKCTTEAKKETIGDN